MKSRLWIILPALIGLLAGLVYVPEMEEARDFLAYREAARILGDGDIYGTAYVYPPTFAFLFQPIAWLPVRASACVWYGLNVAFLAASLYFTARVCGLKGWWAVLPFLLTFRFVNNTLRSGQSNILILFLACLAMFLLSRKRRWETGFSLAGAAVLKVWPALFIVTQILRRRWIPAAGAGTGVIILTLVPVVMVGPSGLVDLLGDWNGRVVSPYLDPSRETLFEETETGYIPGQSIRATVHRLLRPIDATAHDEKVIAINVLDVSRSTAEIIYLIITFTIGIGYLWVMARGKPTFSLEFALTVLFIFLLSPYVRKGHACLLMIPYGVAIAACKDGSRWALAAVLVSFILASLPARFLLGTEGATLAAAFSSLLWGVLVLFAWTIGESRRPSGEDLPP